MSYTKRPATEEEIAKAKQQQVAWRVAEGRYGDETACIAAVDEKHAEAIGQGYEDETCSCGVVFLAFHHFCLCKREGCPFSDGVTLHERMREEIEKVEAEAELNKERDDGP